MSEHAVDRMQRALRLRWEERLGEAALRRVLLQEGQLAEALLERDRGGQDLSRILIGKGWISREDLEGLSESLKQEELSRPSSSAGLPGEVEAASRDPSRCLAQFVLVSKSGSGGAAEVWKAWDRVLGRWVAVKIPRFLPESRTAVERFTREAHAVAKLAHPHIIPIHAVSEDAGQPYLVMPYVEGRTLAGGKREPREAARLMQTLAQAVDYAHAQGVIHRDIKPGNLLLDSLGRPWIFDFGLVYLPEEARQLTVPGTVVGTPAYMSPEQAEGSGQARGPATDVYGLGASLYELVTGQAPFSGTSVADILVKVRTEEPRLPRKLEPGLDRDLERIILKAMDKDPRGRYSSAGLLAEDLGRFLSGETVLAKAPSPWFRVRRRVGKQRRLLLTGAAALVVSGALGVWIGRGAAMPPAPRVVVLGPDQAILHGSRLAVHDTGPRRHVAGWNSVQGYLEWFVSVPKAGWYKVELTYATAINNGGTYVLRAGGEEWSGKIAPTGSWESYRTILLGTLHLPLEKSRLTLGAREVSGGLMDFKELRLTLDH